MPGGRVPIHDSRALQYAAAVVRTLGGLPLRHAMRPEWGLTLPFITLFPSNVLSAFRIALPLASSR